MSHNIIQLHESNKDNPIWFKMSLCLELMPTRGMSVTVFVCLLRDVEVEFKASSEFRLHYENALNTYGKQNWLQFLKDIGRLTA